MKLLVDMNLSPRWTEVLGKAGFEAVHWSTVGAPNAPDRELMSYAVAHDCVVLTHDLDFGAILAATQGAKPSVVQVRSGDVSPQAIAAQVVAALRQMQAELGAGALVTIDPGRTRLRVLPLRPSEE
jgi:predicted nuclease of predicted toxin-antitoxin system